MKERLVYVDNLRIFLIILVVLHHLAITYGAPGSWYYKEVKEPGMLSFVLLTLFVAANQSFFMALFFFIAAFFIPPSYKKKGAAHFAAGRLKRLGIPLAIYFFVINPMLVFFLHRVIRQRAVPVSEYLNSYLHDGTGMGTGPLWFVAALLVFTLCYILLGKTGLMRMPALHFPGRGRILLTAFILGIVTFLIRLVYPVGMSIDPAGFQPAHFAQYIFLFIMGIVARENRWLREMPSRVDIFWPVSAFMLVFVLFPSIFRVGGALSGGESDFMGGFTWQSFVYSVWEQFACFSLILTIVPLFRKRFNAQGKIAKALSESAYTVFIIHAPVIVVLAWLASMENIPAAVSFAVNAIWMVPVCFLVAMILKRVFPARGIL